MGGRGEEEEEEEEEDFVDLVNIAKTGHLSLSFFPEY